MGLIGNPNVGKSTLLSRISSATPKIADYPFTTLSPNLGVVLWGDRTPFVVADIPGLIEGASRGAGLGLTFLRHIERTRLLVHLLDVSEGGSQDPARDFRGLNQELKAHHPSLQEKTQIVALNKIDLPGAREKVPRIQEQFEALGCRVYPISGKTGEGVDALVEEVSDTLNSLVNLVNHDDGA